MASDRIMNVSQASFEDDVLGSEQPVLVDFWATWCGPCRAVAPVLEEVAQELDGSVKVAKVDVDQNRELAAKYDVQGIPSFVLFKNGEVAGRTVGALPKQAFLDFVSQTL